MTFYGRVSVKRLAIHCQWTGQNCPLLINQPLKLSLIGEFILKLPLLSLHTCLLFLVCLCSYMTGGEKDNMNPALIWRHLSVICCCIWVVLCFYRFDHQYYLVSSFFGGENINSTQDKHQMYQFCWQVADNISCMWYLHGCNNLTLGPSEKKEEENSSTWISYMCPFSSHFLSE